MTGATLEKKLIALYGTKFHTSVAKETGMDVSTIYRWCVAQKVPGIVVAWINLRAPKRRPIEQAPT